MAQYDNTTATYRYFVVNLVTNQQIAEIPFKGVSYQRALKGAGSFGGTIAVNPETEHLQLYETTMPGRTALYVVRDNVCVWGGIIWSRSYNVNERVLNVSASEFTSYFYHRRIWKTWGQTFQATLTAKDGFIDADLSFGSTYALEPGSTVRYVFYNTSNFIYNGYYTILDSPAPTESTFRTTNLAKDGTQAVPNGVYENATVYAKTNTYDYVRTLIEAVAQDFSGIDFPNAEIEPAKKTTVNVTSRQAGNGVAIITVDTPLAVVPGQEIELKNVAPELEGLFTVSTVSSDGLTITVDKFEDVIEASNVSKSLFRVTEWEASGNVATVTTNAAHGLFVGQTVSLAGLDPLDTVGDIYDGTAPVKAIPSPTKFSYSIAADVTVLPVALSAPTASVSSTFFLTRQEIETISGNTVATLTTGEPHDFNVGQTVNVAGFKDYTTITRTSANATGITYTTASRHFYQVTKNVTVSGLADTANITAATATRNTVTNVTTFSITTATPHNLVTGDAVTVSGMTDTYNVSSYQYFSSNSILRLTTSENTNIRLNNGQSITVAGMSARTTGATNVTRSGSTVTITTNIAHGLVSGQSVNVSGFSFTYSRAITSLNRVDNVTTVVTSTAHGFTDGQVVTVTTNRAPSNFARTNVAISVVNATSFSYSNPVAPTVTPDTQQTSYVNATATLNTVESFYYRVSGGTSDRITSGTTDVFNNYKYLYPAATSTTTTIAKRAAVRFTSLADALPAGISISNVSAVTSVDLRLTRVSGVGYTDAIAAFGISADGDLTNSENAPARISGTSSISVTGWSLGETRTFTLPSTWNPFFADGTAKTVLVGLQNDGWTDVPANQNRLIAFQGRGSSSDSLPSTAPRLTVRYQYTVVTGVPGETISSNDSYSNANAATVTATISGVNGTYSATAVNDTQLTFTSPQQSPDFSTTSVTAVRVTSGTNPFNGTYTPTEVIARTANTIDINKTFTGLTNIAATATTGTISTPSNFNGTYNVTYINPTSVSWNVSNTQSYMFTNVSRAIAAGQGQAVVLSTDFNVTNRAITAVTNTTFTVANPTGKVKVDGPVTPTGVGISDSPLVGTYTITAKTTDSFKYNVATALPAQTGTPIYGYANAASTPTLTYGTYGPYASQSNVAIEFSTSESLGSDVLPIEFRGFEVRNVGEELDKYTDIIDGFDYRIDCHVDTENETFSRQFVFLPIIPPAVKNYKDKWTGIRVVTKRLQSNVAYIGFGTSHAFTVGESVTVSDVDATFDGTYTITAIGDTSIRYAKTASNVSETAVTSSTAKVVTNATLTSIPLSYYDADKLVFEFPGNISDLQLEESAENSATRFFMVGNIGDLGDDISQPYAVATATDLLSPDVGNYPWPLLDDDESSEDIEDEATLYNYAERYLLENRPPEGKFTVSVNGSLEPVIGTYAPGDWCALIINDAFVQQRLSSELEPRNTVLLRKINSMKVAVPDSVTFPEQIELELIPEWQVDQRGQ